MLKEQRIMFTEVPNEPLMLKVIEWAQKHSKSVLRLSSQEIRLAIKSR